jgi:hypothetical protein
VAVPEIVSARNRHNVLVRHHGADDPVTLDARRDLHAAQIEDCIRRIIDQAPPLTAGQLDRLAALLHAAPASDGAP